MYDSLLKLKASGLHVTADLLVYSFLQERGEEPVGKIADATGLSISSVEKARAKLRRLELLSDVSPQAFTVDHDQIKSTEGKRTEEKVTVRAVSTSDDPLGQRMLDFGMWPGAVRTVLTARTDRGHIAEQLNWHEYRVAAGFDFRVAPAALLTTVLKDPSRDYAPAGFYESRARAAAKTEAEAAIAELESEDQFDQMEELTEEERAEMVAAVAELRNNLPTFRAPAPTRAAPTTEPEAPKYGIEGARTALALLLKSKRPGAREEARQLAARFGLPFRETA